MATKEIKITYKGLDIMERGKIKSEFVGILDAAGFRLDRPWYDRKTGEWGEEFVERRPPSNQIHVHYLGDIDFDIDDRIINLLNAGGYKNLKRGYDKERLKRTLKFVDTHRYTFRDGEDREDEDVHE